MLTRLWVAHSKFVGKNGHLKKTVPNDSDLSNARLLHPFLASWCAVVSATGKFWGDA